MNSDIPSLQHAALKACIGYQELHVLPPKSHLATLFKHFEEMWIEKEFDNLYLKYCNFKLFVILLDEKYRTTLLKTFSSVSILNGKPSLADVLLESYKESNAIKNDLELGLKFAQFFIELGIFTPAVNFLEVVAETCKATNNQEMLIECYGQMIYAFSFEHKYREALTIYSHVRNICAKLRVRRNCANVLSNISFMHMTLGDFYQALVEANSAIRELNNQLPIKYCFHLLNDILKCYKKINFRVIIKVLRLSARVFTVNREYRQARLLIQHALTLSEDYLESDPYIQAEVSMDYGFYLSKLNYRFASMKAYIETVGLYKRIYNEPNLYHVIAERDFIFNMINFTPDELSLTKQAVCMDVANIFLTRVVQNIKKLGKGTYIMLLTTLTEIRALLLEKHAVYKQSSPAEIKQYLTAAKESYNICLRSYKIYLDKVRKEPSIKTVNCLIAIGRVCQQLNELSDAETAFRRAETITETLRCRTNTEYFGVKIHRAQLYRTNTHFFKRKGTILLAIKTMERCRKLLIKFEGYNCEILDKFFDELIQLYNHTEDNAKVKKYQDILLAWRTQFNLQKFRPVTDRLSKTVSMQTIIDKIRTMNIENQTKIFDYAVQIARNET